MAEESPRPPTDEEEEGEEAAEAPLVEVIKKVEPVLEDCKAEAAKPEEKPKPEVKPKPEEKKEVAAPVKASAPRAAPKPLLPSPPAFSHPVPTVYPALPQPYYPSAAPAFPSATTTTAGINLFANDGSFLELFKKKMEEKPAGSREEAASPEEEKKPEAEKRRPISFVGKRRGGAKLALKTGMVAKKPKTDEEEVVVQKGGAWAQYMAEVKKYKAHQCSDDDKTRPLVK